MKAMKRVLVVDDDPVVRLSIDRVLTPKGYAVISVASGADALDRLKREDYDVVYTDIRMPEMDGLEVARRIRASRPWLPVLIITGYGDGENEAAARAIGVSAFLHKPLTPDTIEGSAAKAVSAPEATWAPVAIPAAPAPAAAEKRGGWHDVRLAAKNIGLFFAAPFITLFYVLAGPFVLLGMIGWFAVKALMPGSKTD